MTPFPLEAFEILLHLKSKVLCKPSAISKKTAVDTPSDLWHQGTQSFGTSHNFTLELESYPTRDATDRFTQDTMPELPWNLICKNVIRTLDLQPQLFCTATPHGTDPDDMDVHFH